MTFRQPIAPVERPGTGGVAEDGSPNPRLEQTSSATRAIYRPLSAFLTLPVLGAFVLFALFTGRFASFAVFLASLALCCFLYALFSRFGLRVDIQAPRRAVEGETVDLTLLLDTRWPLPKLICRSGVEVLAPTGDGGETGGACKREHGLFYHLHERPTSGLGRPPAAHETQGAYEMDGFILWRGRCRIHREIGVPFRGALKLKALKLYFSDPLGIFALRRSWPLGHEVLVRVRPASGAPLLDVAGACGRIETHKRIGESGDVNEYAGTRPYRPGDELRYLHWPTVARTGELHVREYTPSSADSVAAILFHGPNAPTGGQVVEATLRALVAFVIELFNRRIVVSFGANVGETFACTIGYSKRNLQRFHDHVSRLSFDASPADERGLFSGLVGGGVERPAVVVFRLGEMTRERILAIATVLRVGLDQLTVVDCVGEGGDESGEALRGVRTVRFAARHPEQLFSRLHLSKGA